jgi:TolA-binding protein
MGARVCGDKANARRLYYQLIQQYPASPLVPFAYFGLGELFWVEAKADPSKYDLAQQAYQAVHKTPTNPLYAEAQRRLREVARAKRTAPPRLP